jgi:peptide/nickel transport system permease protein
MYTFLLKRLSMTVIVILIVMIFLGLLVHVVPGDPVTALLGPRATPELIATVRSQMDLDKPVYVQVVHFIWNALHGNLGVDFWTGRSIRQSIGDVLPNTIVLAVCSLGLAVLIGIPLGVYSATHPNSWIDRILAVISISFITIPSYIAALLLLMIFAVQLNIMPAIGLGKSGDILDYLRHLVLPAISLAITWVGYLARLVRTSLLEVLNTNYIRASKSFGLRQQLIFYKYALKNALIPTVTVLGVGLGSMMGGAMFVEVIFARPGMGTLIFNAINSRNFPTVRAGVLVVAVLFVLANLLADLVNSWLDPRIQLNKGQV